MSAARANQPKKALNFLTLDTSERSPSVVAEEGMENAASFEGFEIKTDPQMAKLWGKPWADIQDSSSCATSAFNTPFDVAREPQFISPPAEGTPVQFPHVVSPPVAVTVESDAALKTPSGVHLDEEGSCGSDGDDDDSNGLSAPPLEDQQDQQDPLVDDYQQMPPSYVLPPLPVIRGLPAPRDPNFVANPELIGFLPFIEYTSEATDTELLTAAQFGDLHAYGVNRPQKMFFGHLWSRLPTGSLQWLLDTLVRDDGSNKVYGAQLHFNKEGWFRGCLHASVITPSAHEVMYRLHKRVLFDHTGIWYAETDEQRASMNRYCEHLRTMPQHLRHQKLNGLPCNPIACEMAANEQQY